jgi:hypothetical protein
LTDRVLIASLAMVVFVSILGAAQPPSAFGQEITIYPLVVKCSSEGPFYIGETGILGCLVRNAGKDPVTNVEIRIEYAMPYGIEIVETTPPKDLQPGATENWQVKLLPTKAGTYEISVGVYVNGESVYFRLEGYGAFFNGDKITVVVSERPFFESPTLYLSMALVAAVILVLASLVVIRKRRASRIKTQSEVPAIRQ